MRLAYLFELLFASKELARAVAEPTTAGLEALKRCIRLMLKYPRCIQSFERQEISRTYQTYRNPDAMVATSRDQWRQQDDSSWWK